MAKRLVIGICGGTGSGKTTITERIISALSPESVLVLQQDHYYKDLPHLPLEQRARQNFDHPDSFDTLLLIEHVRQLREGQAIDRPVYDFYEAPARLYDRPYERLSRDDSRRHSDL